MTEKCSGRMSGYTRWHSYYSCGNPAKVERDGAWHCMLLGLYTPPTGGAQ